MIETANDAALRDAVKRHLAWAAEVNGACIGVAAHGGVVTLRGYADNVEEVRAAGRIAGAVAGVRAVINEMEVWPGAFQKAFG